MIELQEIIDKAKKYKDMYEGYNEGFNSLYRDLLELNEDRASAHNSDYMECEYCKYYYADMEDGINFCPHCGSELKKHFA